MVFSEPEPSGLIIKDKTEIQFNVQIAHEGHFMCAEAICNEMYVSAIERGSGISKRSPDSLRQKMKDGEAIIAFTKDGEWAGFSYISAWDDGHFVSNSGLIVAHAYRKSGLAVRIKQQIFDLSRQKYPEAKIFSLTSGLAVMKMNTHLGFVPVTYSELTQNDHFWDGCKSCINYQTLQGKERKNCLCTAMLFEPKHGRQKAV